MNKMFRRHVLLLFLGIAAACLLFTAQYYLDNKYQFHGPFGSGGALDLRDDAHRIHMLAYGWEIYNNMLLFPEDMGNVTPSDYVCLGEYGGFESENNSNSPHGYATYHLTVELPSNESEYMLEIPEIYSASRVYVNGALLWQSGNPNPQLYSPCVRSGAVTFAAAHRADILVQAADYSHYYSGMVYPPAFGPASSVNNLLAARFLIRCIMCLSAFGTGFIYLITGIKVKERRVPSILFSLFAFSFAGYACYPVIHVFGTGMWAYTLEDLCFYLMLFMIAALQTHLCCIQGKARAIILSVCGSVCLLSVVAPNFLLEDNLNAMLLYSDIIDLYKLALFGWLISTGFLAFRELREHTLIFLNGLCIFAVALLFNISAPMFEPILLGWQTEIAAFLFVMSLAFTLWRDIADTFAKRCTLSENIRMMKRQLALQGQNYHLLTEHFEAIRTMKHDIRQHFRVLGELLKSGDYEGLSVYLSSVAQVSNDLNTAPICQNTAVNAILQYYAEEARRLFIPLTLNVSLTDALLVEGWELGVMFGNLIENALEASMKLPDSKRCITVHAGLADDNLLFTVQNNYDGSVKRRGNLFYSSKHDGYGIGLSSVRNLVDKYGGEFIVEPGTDTFQASVVLWNVLSGQPSLNA